MEAGEKTPFSFDEENSENCIILQNDMQVRPFLSSSISSKANPTTDNQIDDRNHQGLGKSDEISNNDIHPGRHYNVYVVI